MKNLSSGTVLNRSIDFNKVMYSLMIVTGIVYLLLKDWSMAAVMAGLALAFDPFDQKQKWDLRPLWQRAWLCIHLAIAFALFVFSMLN